MTLQIIMQTHPDLTAEGFGVNAHWQSDFAEERASLARSTAEFDACREWLTDQPTCKHPNRKIGTTYGLKSKVERACSMYIPEGALIAAAISLNIPYVRKRKSASAYLGLSRR